MPASSNSFLDAQVIVAVAYMHLHGCMLIDASKVHEERTYGDMLRERTC
jgi:hypothetical protein